MNPKFLFTRCQSDGDWMSPVFHPNLLLRHYSNWKNWQLPRKHNFQLQTILLTFSWAQTDDTMGPRNGSTSSDSLATVNKSRSMGSFPVNSEYEALFADVNRGLVFSWYTWILFGTNSLIKCHVLTTVDNLWHFYNLMILYQSSIDGNLWLHDTMLSENLKGHTGFQENLSKLLLN